MGAVTPRPAVIERWLGVIVEGIDMIHWNDADQITSVKVMIRPIKALQTLVPRMAELLAGH